MSVLRFDSARAPSRAFVHSWPLRWQVCFQEISCSQIDLVVHTLHCATCLCFAAHGPAANGRPGHACRAHDPRRHRPWPAAVSRTDHRWPRACARPRAPLRHVCRAAPARAHRDRLRRRRGVRASGARLRGVAREGSCSDWCHGRGATKECGHRLPRAARRVLLAVRVRFAALSCASVLLIKCIAD